MAERASKVPVEKFSSEHKRAPKSFRAEGQAQRSRWPSASRTSGYHRRPERQSDPSGSSAPQARAVQSSSLSAKYRYRVVRPIPNVSQMVAAVSPLVFIRSGQVRPDRRSAWRADLLIHQPKQLRWLGTGKGWPGSPRGTWRCPAWCDRRPSSAWPWRTHWVGRHMPNRGPTNVSPGRSCDTENRL